MHDLIAPAIEQLCAAFEKNGYNPTPVIDIGVLVAYADGNIDAQERMLLMDVFQTLLGTKLMPEVVDALVTSSVEVIEAAGAEPRARLVSAILSDCEAVEPGLRVALAIAFASEGLSPAERTVIDRIAKGTGLSKARVDALIEEVRQFTDDEGPVSARRSLVPALADRSREG